METSQPRPFTLYAFPFACSLAAHAILRERGFDHEIAWIEPVSGLTVKEGMSFAQVNPKGVVPTLRTPEGTLITENIAVLLHLADTKGGSLLAPPPGDTARDRLHEWLSFVATELHKQVLSVYFSFDPGIPEQSKSYALKLLPDLLDYLNRSLEGRESLVSDRFTVVDAYLGWALLLIEVGKLADLEKWPEVRRYREKIASRPSMRDAVSTERAVRSRSSASR